MHGVQSSQDRGSGPPYHTLPSQLHCVHGCGPNLTARAGARAVLGAAGWDRALEGDLVKADKQLRQLFTELLVLVDVLRQLGGHSVVLM